MTLSRARVIPREHPEAGNARPLPLPAQAMGTRLAREALAADEHARAVVAAAERRARVILDEANRAADSIARDAEARGRAEGAAEALALALRLSARERDADALTLDRSIDLARLLAERLLGHSLAASPGDVARLARSALDEARGARRVRIFAHAADAPVLSEVLAELDPDGRVHAVTMDAGLGRGDLRIETDAGVVDARLGPSIARLAERMRELLGR